MGRGQEIFIDTADIDLISQYLFCIDGVTTNQVIMAKARVRDIEGHIRSIARVVGGRSVSVELMNTEESVDRMVVEGVRLSGLGENIAVKVPIVGADFATNKDSRTKMMEVAAELGVRGVVVNVTMAMHLGQTMVVVRNLERNSIKPGFVSIFWKRADQDQAYRDAGGYGSECGMEEVTNQGTYVRSAADIVRSTRDFIGKGATRIIVGSIGTVEHVVRAFQSGADIVTVPAGPIGAMLYSRRSIETAREFDEAAASIRARDCNEI